MEWYVGIDWGSDSHQVEVQNQQGEVIFNDNYGANPTDLLDLRQELLEFAESPGQITVAIEDPTRTVTRVLLQAGMEVWVLTPRKMDAVRSAYSEAGAKGDALDAHILCEELRVHQDIFYKLEARKPVIATLNQYHRAFAEAKQEVSRFANRLREKLRDYFPQFLELDWSVSSEVMLNLFQLMPTPKEAEEVELEAIREAIRGYRKHTAQEVIQILNSGPNPLDERTKEAAATVAQTHARQLRVALEAKQRWDDKMESLLVEIADKQKAGQLPSAGADKVSDQQPNEISDVEIAMSIKGLGVRCVAGLFAEGFQAIVTGDRQLLRRQSIAPVTKQTGKQTSGTDGPDPFVHRRHARNRYLNNTMHQIGDSLQRSNDHYRARYIDMKKQRNHTHGRACRQITDQFLRVLFAMLRDRTTYNANLHGATLC